jgi:hypothetical protein
MGRRDQERCIGGRSLVELTGDPRCSRRYRSVRLSPSWVPLSRPCPVWEGGSFSARTCQLPPSQSERRWAIQGGMVPPQTLVALGE